MEQTIDDVRNTDDFRPRNPWIAFVLSLLIPGLGHVYIGQARKGFIIFSLLLIVPVFCGFLRVNNSFAGLLTVLVLEITIRLYGIINAVVQAKKRIKYIQKHYNTWYYHLLTAIILCAILISIDLKKITGNQTYRIPMSANEPTLQIGDYAVADMKAYELKKPDYGDFVSFLAEDGFLYNFRVIGKPFDKIDIIGNSMTINDIQIKTTFIKETFRNDIPFIEMEEELPNGHKHRLFLYRDMELDTTKNALNISVPADSYFLLGDNRDMSQDSRFIGPVHEEQIKGRVLYTYWGKNLGRINIDLRNK